MNKTLLFIGGVANGKAINFSETPAEWTYEHPKPEGKLASHNMNAGNRFDLYRTGEDFMGNAAMVYVRTMNSIS